MLICCGAVQLLCQPHHACPFSCHNQLCGMGAVSLSGHFAVAISTNAVDTPTILLSSALHWFPLAVKATCCNWRPNDASVASSSAVAAGKCHWPTVESDSC